MRGVATGMVPIAIQPIAPATIAVSEVETSVQRMSCASSARAEPLSPARAEAGRLIPETLERTVSAFWRRTSRRCTSVERKPVTATPETEFDIYRRVWRDGRPGASIASEALLL